MNEGAPVTTGEEVIVGTCDGVFAFTQDQGAVLWSRADVRAGQARPAWDGESIFFCGSQKDSSEEILYKLDPSDGSTQTTVQLRADTLESPAVGEGSVFVAATDNDAGTELSRIYRLTPGGDEQWHRTIRHEGIQATPVVNSDTVYIVVGRNHDDARLVALEAATGESRWVFDALAGVNHPVAVTRATAYVATAGNTLVALHASSGEEQWRYELDAGAATAPSAATNGVCVTADDGTLHAVSEDGERLWTASFEEGPYFADPAVVDGSVIAGGRRLVAFE